MIVTGNDKRNAFLDKELMKGIPCCRVTVHAVAGQKGKKRFVEKDKLVLERPVQLRRQPFELLSGNPAPRTGNFRVQQDKKGVAVGKGVIRGLKKVEVPPMGNVIPHIMVAGYDVQELVGPGDLLELIPLAFVSPVRGVTRMDYSRDPLPVNPFDDFRVS
jgi:hypothetical protein